MTEVDSAAAVSADGTAIGYHLIGAGPPLLVLHGAMQSALSQRDLATALADRFTVVLPDRRGRGASGPFGDWSLAREVEDVAAVRAATGAASAVGVSSGALILLNAALSEPFERLALFEPPLLGAGEAPAGLVVRLEQELARGDVAAALVTGMRGARMGPALVRALPRPLLQRMTAAMMDRGGGDLPSFRELAATLPCDSRVVAECAGTADRYRAVTAPTLLVGGSRSARYLKTALSTVEGVLPDARRVEIAGIDHGGTENADRRGKPALVAAELTAFL
jgi:pimeloyl-ACP methyl ester carboxylesterase